MKSRLAICLCLMAFSPALFAQQPSRADSAAAEAAIKTIRGDAIRAHMRFLSADHVQRTPLSKQRNKHLQTRLIEAAKMAPRYSPTPAMLYDREEQKGNANRATLAVARKLVAYLVAVDRGQTHFLVLDQETRTAA
jgi:hypothetical protein